MNHLLIKYEYLFILVYWKIKKKRCYFIIHFIISFTMNWISGHFTIIWLFIYKKKKKFRLD